MMKETHPHFAGFGNKAGRGIGGHHSARSATDEWLTPPGIIAALGGPDSFDLDPCAPMPQPYPTARATYTKADNGLTLPWFDRVWLNSPYSAKPATAFLRRMVEHGRGTALIFARTETKMFTQLVLGAATAVLVIAGRLNFHYGPGQVDDDGKPLPLGERAPANSGAPSWLIAYGLDDTDILAAACCPPEFDGPSVIWPEGRIPGTFVPLRIPRSMLLPFFDRSIDDETEATTTWRAALERWMAEQDGPVELSRLYQAFADHPKAKGNPHFREKLRQELQRGAGRRVGRGLWEKAP